MAKDEDIEIEQELRNLYYDPRTGYQSAEGLFKKAKEEGLNVTRKEVREWFVAQDTYTTHKPAIKPKKLRKTIVSYLGEQLQMDLIDMRKYEINGYKWILTAVEVLSRFAFTVPVERKTADLMRVAVKTVMTDFKKKYGQFPRLVQFDQGTEFYNSNVKKYLAINGIKYFSSKSDKKAAIVERFNRTLKTKMWRYFYAKGTRDWVSILPELTSNYNNTKHTSILMKPSEVTKENASQVWTTLYGHNYGALPINKYKVGDKVRISKYKKTFKKGYEANFSDEVFEVANVIRGDPNTYELREMDGEPIIGKFYEEELTLVDKTDHVFRVEKVLKTKKSGRNKLAFVKWEGYDNKHNSWVPEDSIKDIG